MKRILIVFGTRPESLKIYPLIHYAKDFPDIDIKTYFTYQHEKKYIEFEPTWAISSIGNGDIRGGIGQIYADLDWFMQKGGTHKNYDYILVQGDTFSALAGALWGYYNKIPVIHVEAGLRTYKDNPFPEETNRVMIDRLSSIYFCPTGRDAEHIWNSDRMMAPGKSLEVIGNTIIDRLKMAYEELVKNNTLSISLHITNQSFFLCTLHRRESWDQFESMMGELKVISEKNRKLFYFIGNPNKKLNRFFCRTDWQLLYDPQSYSNMVRLLYHCKGVITDSGGLIEEAAYLRKPCYILRDETERQDSIDANLAKLMGIKAFSDKLIGDLADQSWFDKNAKCPYGEGDSAMKILSHLDKL